jgi:hypothetical protein
MAMANTLAYCNTGIVVAVKSVIIQGPGKTAYAFSVTFRLACYQQAGRVWSGRKGMENTLALAENVYVVLPTP